MDPFPSASEPPLIETAILVGVCWQGHPEWETRESLEELGQLAESAGAKVLETTICRQEKPRPGHLIGTGQAERIGQRVAELQATTVFFDEDLSPAQGRNLEKMVKVKVLDRTQLILDIFARRAQTREGCLQVELAQYEYLLPRLRRMWTHLERQKGGIGLRGPGEQQIEMDRRRIQQYMSRLKREIEKVRRHRAEQRRGRRRHGWALLSLVGYTNAGKSTLLNKLTDAHVVAENQLFATLDPTTRSIQLPNNQSALVTDTVGFIRKLPHHLVDSFKATLEEVVEADVLVHVIDASHPQVDDQIEAVHSVLFELEAHEKEQLYVLNKMDTENGRRQAARLRDRLPHSVCLSAKSGEGVEEFLVELADRLRSRARPAELLMPQSEARLLSELRRRANILSEDYEGNDVHLQVRVPPDLLAKTKPFHVHSEEA